MHLVHLMCVDGIDCLDNEIEESLKKETTYGALIQGAIPYWGYKEVLSDILNPEKLIFWMQNEKLGKWLY